MTEGEKIVTNPVRAGGISSARRAATHGVKTIAVIEQRKLGGTCVNVGCVPKKVMFNTASIIETMHASKHYDFVGGTAPTLDLKALRQRRDRYISRLNDIYASNLEKSGVQWLTGHAKFVDAKTVDVDGTRYSVRLLYWQTSLVHSSCRRIISLLQLAENRHIHLSLELSTLSTPMASLSWKRYPNALPW